MLIQTCIVTGILLGLGAFGVTQEKPDFFGGMDPEPPGHYR